MSISDQLHQTEKFENLERIEREGLIDWVSKNMGGRVLRIWRQRRWRPVWHVDVEIDGAVRGLVFKGFRVWPIIPYSMQHEINMINVLKAHDVPVANVHGLCEFPPSIAMDRVGEARDAGMVLQSIEEGSKISDTRWQASLSYMDILARMHSIPPAEFVKAGIKMPETPAEIALNHFEGFYQMMLDADINDPFMDFCRNWFYRNVPEHRTKVTYVTGDCGQFLAEGKDIKITIDHEIGHLGDPMHDLACYRGRHPVEDMGDLKALYKRYEEATGDKVDIDAIGYHTAVFMALAYLGPLFGVDQTMAGGDWAESTVQSAFVGRRCAEGMAEIMGVTLDKSITLPDPHPHPIEEAGLRKLICDMKKIPTSELFPEWQRDLLVAVPEYMINQFRYGHWVEQQDLDDVETLLGQRPANRVDADVALRDFIAKAGPEHDEALIKLFYRRMLRWCHSIVGPDAPANHLVLLEMEPLDNLR